ncbi:hypothetical protein IF1G_06673 [Cordyceps javanica]|uniref:Uncharacterized protein n=1 Tax=Cordyceps javanica TaxID=43265 RepID=A0A545UYW1_9HYPO|nr:hypothetical protein IF1G_06673 [Cordyceps javanica]TQW06535.1 hypothetical protein IF2G_05957 [Cordyceps javanica]
MFENEALRKGPVPPSVTNAAAISADDDGASSSLSSSLPSPAGTAAYTSIIIRVLGLVAASQASHSRVSQLAFSPGGSRLAALSQHHCTVPVDNNRRWQRLHVFDATAADWAALTLGSLFGPIAHDYRVRAADGARGLAFGPETVRQLPAPRSGGGGGGSSSSSSSGLFGRKGKEKAPPEVAVPHVPLVFLYGRPHGNGPDDARYFNTDIDMAQIEVGSRKKAAHVHNVPVTEPIAVSPDGTRMIGRSGEDPTEMYVIRLPDMVQHQQASGLWVLACVPGHLAKITHLAYMPDGRSVVSLGADGVQRINSVAGSSSPGQCLHRVRVDARGCPGASLLAVRADDNDGGGNVAVLSVWGRQVVRWHPATDALRSYDLDAVRAVELWPLALSADARVLVCRVEGGVELVRADDGSSLGHLHWTQNGGNYATAAAVSPDGRRLALGLLNGRIMMHELSYVQASMLSDDVPGEEPPAYSKYDD